MSKQEVVVKSGGLGFCGALTILFIALKLTGYIAWSWVWVLAPLWVGVALVISFLVGSLLGIAVLAGISSAFDYFNRRKHRGLR